LENNQRRAHTCVHQQHHPAINDLRMVEDISNISEKRPWYTGIRAA
jgi:hypothetical protein